MATENLYGDLKNIKEAAEILHETPNAIRNWMRELKDFIPTVRSENQTHYFDDQGMEQLRMIQNLNRNQGFTLKQIHYLLSNQDGVTIKKAHTQDDIRNLSDQLNEIKQQLEKQLSFNQEMFSKLDAQQTFIESLLLKERDRQLMQSFSVSPTERKQRSLAKNAIGKLFGQ